jgi:hypothetical protein
MRATPILFCAGICGYLSEGWRNQANQAVGGESSGRNELIRSSDPVDL